jgi:hypothetical protein
MLSMVNSSTLRFSGSLLAGRARGEAEARAEGSPPEEAVGGAEEAAGVEAALATFSGGAPGEGGPWRLHPASARESKAR